MSVVEDLDQGYVEGGPNGKQIRALRSEEAFNTIRRRAEEVNMKVHSDKTALLCIGAAREEYGAYIRDGNTKIPSSKTLKLLGFQFSETPGVSAHIKAKKYTSEPGL